MDWISLLVSLASGAAGGNIVGALLRDKNLGGLANTLAGAFGGGIGSSILQALGVIGTTAAATTQSPELANYADTATHFDMSTLLGNLVGGGAGGAILTWLVALIKDASGDSRSSR